MGVRAQLHVLAALHPGKRFWYPLDKRWAGPSSSACSLLLYQVSYPSFLFRIRFLIFPVHLNIAYTSCSLSVVTHISRTLFSCSSLPCFSSISGSAARCCISFNSERAMSRISCNCFGRFSFTWPSLYPSYFSKISKNLQYKSYYMEGKQSNVSDPVMVSL